MIGLRRGGGRRGINTKPTIYVFKINAFFIQATSSVLLFELKNYLFIYLFCMIYLYSIHKRKQV